MDALEAVGAAFEASIAYARAGERLRATLTTLQPVAAALGDLIELETDLGPEVSTAIDHIQEAVTALIRASEFLNARLEVKMEQLKAASDG